MCRAALVLASNCSLAYTLNLLEAQEFGDHWDTFMHQLDRPRHWGRVVLSIRRLPHHVKEFCTSVPDTYTEPSNRGSTAAPANKAATERQFGRAQMLLRDVSVVIPCLNEETNLAHCIQSVRRSFRAPCPAQVVVADGGSVDGTVAAAVASGAQVVNCAAGRGRQMNAGARSARHNTLLFLHADCRLPDGWHTAMAAACIPGKKQQPSRWGCFESIQLDEPGIRKTILRRGVELRTRMRHMPYGDQALFVDREAFDEVGGFNEWRLLEDVDLVTRLRKKYGRPAIVPLPVQVSARRWQRLGLLRTFAVNQCILMAWHCGVAPDTLAGWYYSDRRRASGDGKRQTGGRGSKRQS